MRKYFVGVRENPVGGGTIRLGKERSGWGEEGAAWGEEISQWGRTNQIGVRKRRIFCASMLMAARAWEE